MIRLRRKFAVAAAIAATATGIFLLQSPTQARVTVRPGLGGCQTKCNTIQHVFVIVKENHTFDNLFGQFPNADGTRYAHVGSNVVLMPQTPDALSRDIGHDSNYATRAVAGGQMNGFHLIPGAHQHGVDVADSQYTQSQIPLYWQYAQHFGLADHFFSTILGPSFPNHLVLIQGNADSVINNPTNGGSNASTSGAATAIWGCDAPKSFTVAVFKGGKVSKVRPCFNSKTIADEANSVGLNWRYYAPPRGQRGYVWSAFDAIKHIRDSGFWKLNVFPTQQFTTDMQGANVAAINWLVPPFNQSEHPPSSECAGENWTVQQINAIMQSSVWKSSVIILTWDDFGGFYDHVVPPFSGASSMGPRVRSWSFPLTLKRASSTALNTTSVRS